MKKIKQKMKQSDKQNSYGITKERKNIIKRNYRNDKILLLSSRFERRKLQMKQLYVEKYKFRTTTNATWNPKR